MRFMNRATTAQTEKMKRKRLREKYRPSKLGVDLVDGFDDYKLMETKEEANEWAIAAMHDLKDSIESQEKVFVGVDVGWNRYAKKPLRAATHILHVSLPEKPVGAFHLRAMKVNDKSDFPEHLRELLQLPNLRACGLDINRDLARLKRKMGIFVPLRIELDRLATIHNPDRLRVYMQYLCKRYLDREIEPTIGVSADYAQDPLPLQLIKYGALEALHFRLLAEIMTEQVLKDPVIPVEWEVGTEVKVFLTRRECVAKGVIAYLGGMLGESLQFGDLMINKGMALVRLTDVYDPSALPFYRKETMQLYGAPGVRSVTLGFICESDNPLLAIDTMKLQLPVKASAVIVASPTEQCIAICDLHAPEMMNEVITLLKKHPERESLILKQLKERLSLD